MGKARLTTATRILRFDQDGNLSMPGGCGLKSETWGTVYLGVLACTMLAAAVLLGTFRTYTRQDLFNFAAIGLIVIGVYWLDKATRRRH
jgi:hypothetical protein